MGMSLTAKIIKEHLISGKMAPGEEIAVKVDQTLAQDATGTMVCLQFEAMGMPDLKVEKSVIYVDHNTLQTGFENADDHRFLQDMAKNIGAYLSRAGNGICHQVHLERFAEPGKILVGADSHTPTAGGMGMLAIGVGGIDVAVAMGAGTLNIVAPRVINVKLQGKPAPWVSAKDIILEVLRRISVKGGVNAVLEYSGPGLEHLSVPERATITNMGAETGATSSVFPSDAVTREFLRAQSRENEWVPLAADEDAEYDDVIEIDLGSLQPLVACPHSPDNVKKVEEIQGMKVDQVMVGSCTNSSYLDLMKVASILRGNRVHQNVSLVLAPGSRQVLSMLTQNGGLEEIIRAGARILECACGPCIGMGQSPPSQGVSLRTINRNFKGRSGTADAGVYLVSPETAAVSAIKGELTDPGTCGEPVSVEQPRQFYIDDSMFIKSIKDSSEIRRGPNIKPLPVKESLHAGEIDGEVLIKTGDNITTDHILPAGSKILSLRSNIPAIAEFVFNPVDPGFTERAKEAGGGIIVGGENYGQGSSREHAALSPMYLGIKAVIAKSIARIHHTNLINYGIIPLVFNNPADYDRISQGDKLQISNIKSILESKKDILIVKNTTKEEEFEASLKLSLRQRKIILFGGILNWTRAQIQ